MEQVLLRSFIVLFTLQACVSAYNHFSEKKDKCEPLKYKPCLRMNYNRTLFPNYMGNRKQSEAEMDANALLPLTEMGCSSDVLYFMCSIYYPVCNSLGRIIPPCRQLCENVHSGCSKIIKRLGFQWPDKLKCDQFPRIKTDICVFPNETAILEPTTSILSTTSLVVPSIKSRTKPLKKGMLLKFHIIAGD